MKLIKFKIPEDKIISFLRLVYTLEMTILISWKEEDFMIDYIVGYLQIETSETISYTMQTEKLEEKFGNFITIMK